jgi:hypothetical protein
VKLQHLALAACCLTATTTLTLTGTTASAAPIPGGPREPVATAQDSIRLRQELLLNADSAYVADLLERYNSGDVSVVWNDGIAMTEAEADAVNAFDADVTEIADRLSGVFGRDSADLAGKWLDRSNGTVRVSVTRDPAGYAAQLAELSTEHVDVAVIAAPFSFAALQQAQERIIRKVPGIAFSQIDEPTNQIQIGLAPDTLAARNAVTALAGNKAMVAFIDATSSMVRTGGQNADAPPFRGGQFIVRSASSTAVSMCTTGFITDIVNRVDPSVFLRDYYVVTAGHCGNGTSSNAWIQRAKAGMTNPPVGTVLGTADRNAWVDYTTADAERIPIPYSVKSHQIQATDTSYRNINYEETYNTDVLGQTICNSGSTTHTIVCGTLKNKSFSQNTQHPYQTRIRYGTATNQPGDSGGAVTNGGSNDRAVGIINGQLTFVVNGVTTKYYYYSQIAEVEYQLGQSEITKA